MRIKLIAALAAVLALALAGIAIAAQFQKADISFSSKKPGSATAIKTHFQVGDPANTAGKGRGTVQIGQVDINFPKDMKFNDNAFPYCTVNQPQQALAQCKKSILATGSTTIQGAILGPTQQASGKITAFNKPRGLLLVISAPGTVLDGQSLQPKLTKTNKLVTVLPQTLAQFNLFLSDFKLTIGVKYGKLKGKRVPYAQLPKKCPKAGKWKITTTFHLATGKNATTPGTVNKCKK